MKLLKNESLSVETLTNNSRYEIMVISLLITNKSFGSKELYKNIAFEVQDGEKIAVIGRNGCGKSTLFNIAAGIDNDYQGQMTVKKGSTVIFSRQEHTGFENMPVVDYITGDLPEYSQLKATIDEYPVLDHPSNSKLEKYSEAIERFSSLNYFDIEPQLLEAFSAYQLDPVLLTSKLGTLSGGQKRLIELIKIQRSKADLALIDEPTNHMDYVAKDAFIRWLKATKEAVLVISHDRDLLMEVDKIIEIRDGQSFIYKGSYKEYLKSNNNKITSEVNEYGLTQSRIKNLKDDVLRFKRLKDKSRDPGTIKRFKNLEEKTRQEIIELEKQEKPSFWIDKESAESLKPKVVEQYNQYKTRNINIRLKSDDSSGRLILEAVNLSLSYSDTPLFQEVSFRLYKGGCLRIHGRNGAGKTTLVRTILEKAVNASLSANILKGNIAVEKHLRIGVYNQEINPKLNELSLSEAIASYYDEIDRPISDQKIRQLLSEYLFDPISDFNTKVDFLSGGQKARLQIIQMLANEPDLLVLDEPTNHLDLPSIEELEEALKSYTGAILYISHDNFFATNLKGEVIQLTS